MYRGYHQPNAELIMVVYYLHNYTNYIANNSIAQHGMAWPGLAWPGLVCGGLA